MNITVVGLGYVGLVTAACLAEWNHRVTGLEADRSKLEALANGRLPFYEPGLDQMVARHLDTGQLLFRDLAATAETVSDADAVIIAVGTHDGNGGWQTETMRKALAGIVPHLRPATPLIVRSTLPPEFIIQLDRLVAQLRELAESDLPILLNPEFTQEGRAVVDFMEPSRVICGVAHDPDGRGVEVVKSIYRQADAPFVVMPAIDASFAKLGSNLFLATKISFANELAALCDAYGARVDTVVDAMAFDPRIGRAFLGAGAGFGGSCLPHQVTMTVKTARVAGLPTPLLAAVDEINHAQRAHLVGRVETMLPDGLNGARIALLGLTFKPETDDLRDAPSITIAGLLLERGASVVAYDPMPSAREGAAAMISGLEVVGSVDEALEAADVALLVTDWAEFRSIDWERARRAMRQAFVIDGRNFLDDRLIVDNGFTYTGFGRGWSQPMPESIDRNRRAGRAPAEVA